MVHTRPGMGRALRDTLALVLVAAAARVAGAQTPAGGDFRVNTHTTASQGVSAVASGPRGEFVVAWQSYLQDGSSNGIFAQRFDGAGRPLGGEFQVNTYTTGPQEFPVVAMGPAGDFTVAWTMWDAPAGVYHARARRYERTGDAAGPEMVLGAVDDAVVTSAAYDGRGNLILVWLRGDGDATGIFGRRYDRAGVPIGADFRANADTARAQFDPHVAAAADGGFVVAWQGVGPDGIYSDIYARRFDAGGAPLGAEFTVNTFTFLTQAEPDVAMSAAGDFLVTWMNSTPPFGPWARWFDAGGQPAGPEFHVGAPEPGYQGQPAVSADASGRFVVAWRAAFTAVPDDRLLLARYVGRGGTALGSRFQANADTTSLLAFPAVSADASGNFVFSWTTADADLLGIEARRFGGLLPYALRVDTAPSAASDGNGVLEPGETVDLRPAWWNRSGQARSFGGSLADLAGPPAAYSILDGDGDYGTLADEATAPCADCYAIAVSAPEPRPAAHWDASALESVAASLDQRSRWRIHVGESFADVPRTSAFYRFVESVLHHGVTTGCGGGGYCPQAFTTREQMAAMVLTAREGEGYRPRPCGVPVFSDVPAASPFCPFVEELARRGVVSGCGGGAFCAGDATTREQMAVFVLRTLDPALQPPACGTPLFADVPASSPFCRWIEELARRGVAGGCGGGNYCPQTAITREQMAVFLTATFGLALYGP